MMRIVWEGVMERVESDRRSLLGAVGGMLGLVALGELGSSGRAEGQATGAAPGAEVMSRVPWPYRPLDADAVGHAAFVANGQGGCMFGVVEPIIAGVARQLGAPFTSFPLALFAYGSAGVVGWGSLCGALNGAAAALALLSARPQPLISELYSWYEREALPDFMPKGARFPNVASVAGSVLCHALAHQVVQHLRQEGRVARAGRALRRAGRLGGAQDGAAPQRAAFRQLRCGSARARHRRVPELPRYPRRRVRRQRPHALRLVPLPGRAQGGRASRSLTRGAACRVICTGCLANIAHLLAPCLHP